MSKRTIGKIRDKIFVEGTESLLDDNEVLVTEKEGYVVLRELCDGGVKTSVIVPLSDFPDKEEKK